MYFSRIALAFATLCLAAAAPFKYPLENGFPNLNATALEEVYKLAGGTLPNGPLPSTLKPDGVQTLQLLAVNELFETAYFTELLKNVTDGVTGYDVADKDYTIRTLTAIVNQESLHVLSVNGALANAGNETIKPCEYNFPVTNFKSAILLAQTFTDVVLGVLPVAQTVFAKDGGEEAGLVPVVGGIIAQEGEQVGYYRYLQQKVAAAAPILTGGAPQFAYTAVSQFIVPGSCPNIDIIGLTAFPTLTVETVPTAKNSTQLFSIEGTIAASNNVSMVYISGANLPVSVPISNVHISDGKCYFFAPFPYEQGFARGLTIGALVSGVPQQYNSTAMVAANTMYGPALIEID